MFELTITCYTPSISIPVKVLKGKEAEEWKNSGDFNSVTIIDGKIVDGINFKSKYLTKGKE